MRRIRLFQSAAFCRAAAMLTLLATMAAGAAPLTPNAARAQANPCNGFGVQPVTLTPTLPTHFATTVQQQGADCMAWQTFISLNWPADPNHPGQPDPNAKPSSFGTPGDTSPTVWETYLEASTVFQSPAAEALWATKRPATKSLVRLSKQGAADLSLSGIAQAFDGKWLTDQRGGLTFYEVRMNQDEYDFITKNVFDLTTAAGQLSCASQAGQNSKGGFNLPSGGGTTPTAVLDTDCSGAPATYGTNVGAIEIKAAWIVLPDDHSLDYRYKTAIAEVEHPIRGPIQATVGLVGLHIVHKVQNAPQFLWATFEQIDNSPDEANGGYAEPNLPSNPNQKPRGGFTFFNPNCSPLSDPVYRCAHNYMPNQPCDPLGKPAGCYPYTAPMQITRLTPVDAVANGVTGYAWGLLPAKSVFNYYRLINVQWPNNPTSITPKSVTPLTSGDITPADASGIVANTTLETYQQSKNACMDCHQSAPIAASSAPCATSGAALRARKVQLPNLLGAGAPYASDYSFIFATETCK